MNSISYLINIVRKYSVLGEERSKIQAKIQPLRLELRRWANKYVDRIIPSGSFVKGTAIRGAADIDLLISLKNQTPFSLKEIYESLYDFLIKSYSVHRQNVSIGIVYQGIKVDLVPAKKQPNVTHPHSIYVSKQDTWTKTNINTHIKVISNSPHRNLIRLFKIWSKLNGLDFSSFVLEMIILEALRKKPSLRIDTNFLLVLEYIIDKFRHVKIYDPANTNNIISDSISDNQKDEIIKAAIKSYHSEFWETIVWGLYKK